MFFPPPPFLYGLCVSSLHHSPGAATPRHGGAAALPASTALAEAVQHLLQVSPTAYGGPASGEGEGGAEEKGQEEERDLSGIEGEKVGGVKGWDKR